MSEAGGQVIPTQDIAELEALLDGQELVGAAVRGASWSDGLRDFRVVLVDGRLLNFRGCIQASFHHPPAFPQPLAIGGWWTDEPSPVVQSLGPEIRFSYRHLVFEVGEGLLRLVCRRLEIEQGD